MIVDREVGAGVEKRFYDIGMPVMRSRAQGTLIIGVYVRSSVE
mgnify:CR=1 FL=1